MSGPIDVAKLKFLLWETSKWDVRVWSSVSSGGFNVFDNRRTRTFTSVWSGHETVFKLDCRLCCLICIAVNCLGPIAVGTNVFESMVSDFWSSYFKGTCKNFNLQKRKCRSLTSYGGGENTGNDSSRLNILGNNSDPGGEPNDNLWGSK